MTAHNTYVRGLTHGVALRYVLADVSEAAQYAQKCHSLERDAARLCSESMVASMLMASQIKADERLTVILSSEKPRCTFFGDVNASGQIRGKLTPSNTKYTPLNGGIQVIKHNAQTELYRGITTLDYQDVESALRTHLNQSVQVASALRIVIDIDDEGVIVRACGILLERLPPVKDMDPLDTETFNSIYAPMRTLSNSEFLSMLDTGTVMGHNLHPLESIPTSWQCKCSLGRVKSMLCTLGVSELEDMIESDKKAEITCDFCNTQYHINEEGLQDLLQQIQG